MPDVNKKEIHYAKLSPDGKHAIFAHSAQMAEAMRKQPGGVKTLQGGVVTFTVDSIKGRIKDLDGKEGLEAYTASLRHGLEELEKRAGLVQDSVQSYGVVGKQTAVGKIGAIINDKKAFQQGY